jgi:PAS domain S-box-containing protein
MEMPHNVVFTDDTNVSADKAIHKLITPGSENEFRFGQVVATIASIFMNMPLTNIDEKIRQVLAAIGIFAGAARSCVVFFSEDIIVSSIHEWCAEGIPSGLESRTEYLPLVYPGLVEQAEKMEEVCIVQVADLPIAANAEKTKLQELGIQSIITIPLISSHRLLGFVGLESTSQKKAVWHKEHFDLLKVVSELFISTMERHRAEATVQTTSMQNKAFLDSVPDSLFQVNRQGIIKSFKPSKQYPLFLSSYRVVGQLIETVFPLKAAQAASASIATALNSGEVQIFECDLIHDNKTMYYETRVMKAGEDDVLIIVRDISERRQSEACDLALLDIAVKVQEERPLDQMIGIACEQIRKNFGVQLLWTGLKEPNDSIKLFITGRELKENLQGIILRWNNSLEGSGVTGTAIRTGKFQLMNIEDPRMVLWRERLTKYFIKSGGAFPLKVNGVILGALTVYTEDCDFWTKRTIVYLTKFAEQIALAIHFTTNRQRLKLLTTGLESASNAIVITGRNGDVQWINPAFLRLNGYDAAEMMTSNIGILESSQHPRTFYKAIRQHVMKGRIWQGEIIICRKDGSQCISETTITPVRDEVGELTNFISIIQDITERKQAESEMAEAREAITRAERLGALGTMAAGIAHEINQPLNSLKVLADGMLYWYKQGTMPEINETMDSIQDISKQAERIDAIIKHMRSFICGSSLAMPVSCNINVAVAESLSLIRSQLLSHNIEVTTALAANLPLVSGSAIQLEQIVINLLVNAMQTLNTIDKSDKQITIVTGRDKNQVFLTIRDNGAGISEELKRKIFDPFFTTKFAGEGMGLGLSIVHSIVTSYGGQIRVKDNKLTEGVTFQIEFPIVNRAKKKVK